MQRETVKLSDSVGIKIRYRSYGQHLPILSMNAHFWCVSKGRVAKIVCVFMPCENRNLETHSHDYATGEESGVFRAVTVSLLPLLRSAEVNTSLVARQQL
jgi:hypothetical protein